MWKDQYPRVKTTHFSDFAKCDVCESAKAFMKIASCSVKRGARRNGVILWGRQSCSTPVAGKRVIDPRQWTTTLRVCALSQKDIYTSTENENGQPCNGSVQPGGASLAGQVVEAYKEHLAQVRNGRNQLYDHMHKAKGRPSQYLAIMMVRRTLPYKRLSYTLQTQTE